jgi:peptidyl-prolyl cis-trans isomerase B (cyclophilin B)
MHNANRRTLILGLLAAPWLAHATSTTNTRKAPMVRLTTNFGPITLELNAEAAPDTVANFLRYVADGHYNGTIFHRVIDGFMIQGGGFTSDMQQKATRAPIRNEADNGLKNDAYTIAMARTPNPDSATSQFFINVANNDFLNFREPSAQGYGYCVFGKVVEGQDVVDQIRKVRTGMRGGHQDVPVEDIVIEKAETVE